MTSNTRPSTEHYFRVRWNRHVTNKAHSDLSNVIAVGNDCYIRGVEPYSRSQWPRGLRRRTTAARLLKLWVRILTRPGESYRLWRVVVCDQETSYARAAKHKLTMGCSASKKKKKKRTLEQVAVAQLINIISTYSPLKS